MWTRNNIRLITRDKPLAARYLDNSLSVTKKIKNIPHLKPLMPAGSKCTSAWFSYAAASVKIAFITSSKLSFVFSCQVQEFIADTCS